MKCAKAKNSAFTISLNLWKVQGKVIRNSFVAIDTDISPESYSAFTGREWLFCTLLTQPMNRAILHPKSFFFFTYSFCQVMPYALQILCNSSAKNIAIISISWNLNFARQLLHSKLPEQWKMWKALARGVRRSVLCKQPTFKHS